MSDMKCPFCGQELVYLADDFYCPNCYSNKHKHYAASPDVWQALIDTKKKFDIAVDALFDTHKHSYACCNPASEIGYIHAVSYNALEKTCKELEQINRKEEK